VQLIRKYCTEFEGAVAKTRKLSNNLNKMCTFNITITILDIIQYFIFYLKNHISENPFSLLIQVQTYCGGFNSEELGSLSPDTSNKNSRAYTAKDNFYLLCRPE
jgi:hypothetical protein